jgi:type IV pilus assembly protein PilN
MRLDINLASQPYEDLRKFWTQWGTALGLTTILSLALIYTAVTSFLAAHKDHNTISEMRDQIAKLERERSTAQATLNRPENRGTRDQSQFLNELIRRKAFSWTEVFSELEQLMPPRLHVVAIRPELTTDNQLKIRMTVAGESKDRALELIRRMEQSQHFQQTEIFEETDAKGQVPGDNMQLEFGTLYVPIFPRSGQ